MTAEQLALEPPEYSPRLAASIEKQFQAFHAKNPGVYRELVRLARDLKQAGHPKAGVKMLWEVMRWQTMRKGPEADGFKLNNNLTSRYAREVMANEPDLEGFFDIRALTT